MRTGTDCCGNSQLRRHGCYSIVRNRVTLCGCWWHACHTWWTPLPSPRCSFSDLSTWDGRGSLDWQSVMRLRTEEERAGWLGMDRGPMTHQSICDPETLMSVSLVFPGDANKRRPAAKKARRFVRALRVLHVFLWCKHTLAFALLLLLHVPLRRLSLNCSFCHCLF